MPGSGQESANWNPRESEPHGLTASGHSSTASDAARHPAKEAVTSRNQIPGNRFQREAICHFTGPCEVLAGPGSGKTFVIVERILHLIRYHRIDPSRILVLTFSKSAALEMQQRFIRRSAPDRYPVTFGTFHSVFYRILQKSLNHPVSIISIERQKTLVSNLIQRFSCSSSKTSMEYPTDHTAIHSAGNRADSSNDYYSKQNLSKDYGADYGTGNYYFDPEPSAEDVNAMLSMIARCKMTGKYPLEETGTDSHIREILHDYNAYLNENNLVDFEDMIGECESLLRNDPDTLHQWQERFQFLLVDEFQDINAGQFRVISLLAGSRQNLFVVGDDDQSIYGFRGSDPGFMLKFSDFFPKAKVIQLEINYRCCEEIISAAGLVINENRNRIPKRIRADSFREERNKVASARPVSSADPMVAKVGKAGKASEGKNLRIKPQAIPDQFPHFEIMFAESEQEEYSLLCRSLLQISPEERSKSAVIVRTHVQLAGIEKALKAAGIPWLERGSRQKTGMASTFGAFGERDKWYRKSNNKNKNMKLPDGVASIFKVICSYYHLAGSVSSFSVRSRSMPGSRSGTGRMERKDLIPVLNVPERFLLRSKFQSESYTEEEILRLYPYRSPEQKSLALLCRDLHTMGRLSPKLSYRYFKQILLRSDIGLSSIFHLSANISDKDWQILDRTIEKEAESCRTIQAFSDRIDHLDLQAVYQNTENNGFMHGGEDEKDGETIHTCGRTQDVSLITMHASKGLEFESVFLPDLNEGILPNKQAQSEEAVEEERRLFYVAMTRARDHLFLFCIRGSEGNLRRPSRFLEPFGVKPFGI